MVDVAGLAFLGLFRGGEQQMNAYVIELSPISNHNKAHFIRYLIGMG